MFRSKEDAILCGLFAGFILYTVLTVWTQWDRSVFDAYHRGYCAASHGTWSNDHRICTVNGKVIDIP